MNTDNIHADYSQYIIPPEKWDELYHSMPPDCQKFVNEQRVITDGRQLGRNEQMGWFIMDSTKPIAEEQREIIYLRSHNRQLEEENQKLKAALEKLRSELSRKNRSLNRMHRDNYETVHFDDYDR
jgi:predicted RNase H-like nuclease (RuvC/YqgF family)